MIPFTPLVIVKIARLFFVVIELQRAMISIAKVNGFCIYILLRILYFIQIITCRSHDVKWRTEGLKPSFILFILLMTIFGNF